MGEVALKQINVSQFLRQYDSINTRKSYLAGLKKFFELMYPEIGVEIEKVKEKLDVKNIPPEVLLKILDIHATRYLNQDRDYRDDLLKFKESLKSKAPTTMTTRINSIRTFLDDNGIPFPKRFFKNLNGKATEPITYEDIPTNEEIKRICEYMPVHGKALTLMLASSGMRVGETTKLKIEDIDFNHEPAKIRIRGAIAKTGKKRIAFISPEAKEAVEEWLNFRAQYLTQAKGRTSKVKRGSREKFAGLLFPFTPANFNMIWNSTLKKAKLAKFDAKTKRIQMRPHNLRKYFRLRVGRFGRDEAEALMGHQEGLNKVYARFEGESGEQRLADIYKKAIPELSIYERTVKTSRVQLEIQRENRKLRKDIEQLNERNDNLWNEVDGLSKSVNELKGDFVKMFQLIQEEEDFSEVLRKYVKW